jgi:hypothetical protein
MNSRGVGRRIALGRRGRWRRVAFTILVIGGCLLTQPLSAGATSAADRTATHTFLQATYTFDLALIHNTAKTSAAVKQAGAAIAAECPKVLAHAPGGLPLSPSAGGGKPLSPRAHGEADRHQHQYGDLTGELDSALQSAAFQPDSQAIATFAATVTPLRWSNPAIAPAVQAEIQLASAIFEPGPAPAVCADMRSWVASGYKTLSAGTKAAYESRQESLYASHAPPLKHSSEELLKPYEGPAERAILKRREALPSTEILELGGPATTQLHQQLGIEEASGSSTGTLTKSKAFGHGRTHTGTRYDVEAGKGYGPNCPHIITFSVTLPSGDGTVTSSSGSSLRCLSGKKPAPHPQVTCNEGLLQIESSTLPQTRRVRLKLSNGHTIVSSVTLVPRKYGGPAGVYFQMLRGPSPYPVSLSELDANGQVARTVALRAVKHCRVDQVKPAFRQIVKGSAPNGESFFIVGFAANELGHHSFNLEAEGPAFSSNTSATLEPPSSAQVKYFPLQIAVGCEPHPFALLYGQLKTPGATVLAATATTALTPLTQIAIPANLHTPGTLAYSLLDALPTELLVTSATGATLLKVDLTARAKSETEYCEGYVEG